MSEKRFIVESVMITKDCNEDKRIVKVITDKEELYSYDDLYEISDLLNEQQSTITRLEEENEELRQELEENKAIINFCSNGEDEDLHRLIKENEQLRLELDTHKHPLWSTREAERKVNKLADSLADEVKKNGVLNEELNQLGIENMRLKDRIKELEKDE